MKAFIIYLPKSKKSSSIAGELNEEITNLLDVRLFPGVDRYTSWQTYVDSGYTLNDITRFGGGNIDSEIATFFSHFNLWKKCLDLNENILILEHDAKLISDFNLVSLAKFKGDLLNLGLPNWGNRVWEGEGILKREICEGFHDIHKPEEGECQCNTLWLFGAHAYVITPSGAKKLIQSADRDGILPADIFLRQEVITIHDNLPHSFSQKESFSLIQKHRIYDKQEIDAWDY